MRDSDIDAGSFWRPYRVMKTSSPTRGGRGSARADIMYDTRSRITHAEVKILVQAASIICNQVLFAVPPHDRDNVLSSLCCCVDVG